jgi:hypothetical protein
VLHTLYKAGNLAAHHNRLPGVRQLHCALLVIPFALVVRMLYMP